MPAILPFKYNKFIYSKKEKSPNFILMMMFTIAKFICFYADDKSFIQSKNKFIITKCQKYKILFIIVNNVCNFINSRLNRNFITLVELNLN